LPNAITSPGTIGAVSILLPLTNVPLLDPRSCTVRPFSSLRICAWRRETVGSTTGRSAVGARPTITETALRSNVSVPSVLARR
jgi:hypothetical protein